ncbi:MAG: hypothetical protein J7497_12955, partial [Chitinophagaceae bacterium]|nr:hypothetical protein [Chitinophagaceae bacterium]
MAKKYDKIVRENLVRPSKGLMRYLLSLEIEEIIPLPPIIRQTVIERETDTLVYVKAKGMKPFILHIEFQSTNDPRMRKRMAVYDHMLYLAHNMEVISIVIYIGEKKLTMKNDVSFNGNYYSFKLIDIRDMDPELFLNSDNPRETIFAILAGNNKEDRELLIKKILIRLQQLLPGSESELRERIKELVDISNLRGKNTQLQINKEVQKMPIVLDIRKDFRYQQGKSEGKSEGISTGKREALLGTAKKMLKDGVDVEAIHKYTGLTIPQ